MKFSIITSICLTVLFIACGKENPEPETINNSTSNAWNRAYYNGNNFSTPNAYFQIFTGNKNDSLTECRLSFSNFDKFNFDNTASHENINDIILSIYLPVSSNEPREGLYSFSSENLAYFYDAEVLLDASYDAEQGELSHSEKGVIINYLERDHFLKTGNVEILKKDNNYEITYEISFENGTQFSGNFSGQLIDVSENTYNSKYSLLIGNK